MTTMRAKMKITSVQKFEGQDTLTFAAVGKDGAYPDGGLSDDNTYSKYTPSADLKMVIQNPALLDKFNVGDKFYVDFTPAEA